MSNALGDRLKNLRLGRDLTQGQVAEYAHVSRSSLSDIERGEIAPKTIDAIVNLANFYGTTADYLLGLTDDPSPRQDAPLPHQVREVMQLAVGWSATRQDELLAHARVLDAAELEADLREYDRLMGLIGAMAGGEFAVEAAETVLRAAATGDRAGALQLIEAFFAGRAARQEVVQKEIQPA